MLSNCFVLFSSLLEIRRIPALAGDSFPKFEDVKDLIDGWLGPFFGGHVPPVVLAIVLLLLSAYFIVDKIATLLDGKDSSDLL